MKNMRSDNNNDDNNNNNNNNNNDDDNNNNDNNNNNNGNNNNDNNNNNNNNDNNNDDDNNNNNKNSNGVKNYLKHNGPAIVVSIGVLIVEETSSSPIVDIENLFSSIIISSESRSISFTSSSTFSSTVNKLLLQLINK